MQIDYNQPTDNEIRRIVSQALNATEQIKILHDLTGRSKAELRELCGIKLKKSKRGYTVGRPSMWTDAKIQYLIDHPNEKCQDIADKLGLSLASVTSKRHQLGIKRVTVWNPRTVDQLTTAYYAGLRASKIAKLLNLDTFTVQKKITSLKGNGKL